jgi:beta-alanine--pyruvate transaminase
MASPRDSPSRPCWVSPRAGPSTSRWPCWKKGFYVRYGGDTIQLAPPFIAERGEIDRLINALDDALNEIA